YECATRHANRTTQHVGPLLIARTKHCLAVMTRHKDNARAGVSLRHGCDPVARYHAILYIVGKLFAFEPLFFGLVYSLPCFWMDRLSVGAQICRLI
ncbi:Unknown protein, partial [Striga hermonthica]